MRDKPSDQTDRILTRKATDSRKERLAQALRANLKRRKQAGSGRAKGEKDKETSRRGDTHG
jgi:hypothetical protein